MKILGRLILYQKWTQETNNLTQPLKVHRLEQGHHQRRGEITFIELLIAMSTVKMLSDGWGRSLFRAAAQLQTEELSQAKKPFSCWQGPLCWGKHSSQRKNLTLQVPVSPLKFHPLLNGLRKITLGAVFSICLFLVKMIGIIFVCV